MKQLIKETDATGKVWYYTKYNGNRVTEIRLDEGLALIDFYSFNPNKETLEVIREEKI